MIVTIGTARRHRERPIRLMIATVALTVAAAVPGCGGSDEPKTVPDVVGMDLDFAKSRLNSADIEYDYDEDQGTFGIIDESNWVVCGTEPSPGTETSESVWLIVRHWSCD